MGIKCVRVTDLILLKVLQGLSTALQVVASSACPSSFILQHRSQPCALQTLWPSSGMPQAPSCLRAFAHAATPHPEWECSSQAFSLVTLVQITESHPEKAPRKTLSTRVFPSYGATDDSCKHLVQLSFYRFLFQQSGDCLCCRQGPCLCLLTPVSQHFAPCLGQGRGSIRGCCYRGKDCWGGGSGFCLP